MDQITNMLGERYAMFYHTGMNVQELSPLQTLSNSIDIVNTYMKQHGQNLSVWEPGLQDEISRLVNVNWIYQKLPLEPIRKPVLVYKENGKYRVTCGDTRLMALNLCSVPPLVSVVITIPCKSAGDFLDWIPITSDAELIGHVGLDPDSATIYYTPAEVDKDYAVSWLEIGDNSTATHLHDINQKLNMMQQHLDQQTNNFKFSISWAKQPIEWARQWTTVE
jgi:hypothetical protein